MKVQIRTWHILVALALGLMMGFFIQEYVSSQDQTKATKMVPVVVADANISPGKVLRPEVLRVVQWPREVLPAQTAETVKQVAGRLLIAPVTKGEPILLPKLAPLSNQRNYLNSKKLSNFASNLVDFPSTVINDWLGLATDLHKVIDVYTLADTHR